MVTPPRTLKKRQAKQFQAVAVRLSQIMVPEGLITGQLMVALLIPQRLIREPLH